VPPPGAPLGELTPDAAAIVGLPAGTAVLAAAADKACEALGSGALSPEIGSISYGTTATINTTQRRYVEAVPLVPPYPAAVPGAWSLEVQVYRGYWLVDWFKRQFGAAEVAQAASLGVAPEALFDDLVRMTEPGSMGLLIQPTWTPGVRVPGREAKGAMIGFGDVHTRAHVYRAILEGLAFALREGGERAARAGGSRCASCACRAAGRSRRRPSRSPPTSSGCRSAAAHPRRPGWGRDRRRRRARDPLVVRGRGRGVTAGRGDDRPGPGATAALRRALPTAGRIAGCTSG
jgi:sugar (pentulose or hexulose) kinase